MARFLLVDDDEGMVDSMRCFLKAKAHEVFIAHDGHDAQILMQETTFDILILDWDLPDTTGTELCKFYRSTGGVGQVVMLTGRTSKKDTVEGLSAGADDYLTKPISIPEFDARVEAQLRRAAMSNRQPLVFDESMVGKTFAGSYKIDALLGQGAMGIVFKARHTTIDRIAAIKILASNSCWSNDRKRFEREAKAMSLLNHPRIIRIYDYGIAEQNTPFIVMEFLEGMPLNKVLETYGSLPVKDAIALIIQVCEGLEHAHANSMLHRDLKPANIMPPFLIWVSSSFWMIKMQQ
jgi:DNA-binding response OmpR family regulator